MSRRWLALLLIILLAAPLAGCWDNRDPRRRAYVLGLAVDPAPDGSDDILVSVQVPIPAQSRPSGSGGGGGGGGSGEQPQFYLVEGRGPTVLKAMSRAQDEISREIFLGQIRSVILSDQLSEAQMDHVTTSLWLQPDIDESVYILQAKGRAAALLGKPVKLERLPALYFNNVFEAVRRMTVSEPVQMWQYWKMLSTDGWDPVLPIVELSPEGLLAVRGLGLLRNNLPVGSMNGDESQGFLWIMGRTRSGLVSVTTPEGRASARDLTVSRTLTVRFVENKPVFRVEMRVRGEISLTSLPGRKSTPNEVIAEAVEKVIRGQVRAALAKAQQHGTDPFGFGKMLHYRYPQYYDRVDWREVFPTVTVETVVRVDLVRKGILE